MNTIKYVVVQAGGKGTRMLHLTKNKPKALISVQGKPLLMHLMDLYPDKHFLIIVDYKSEVIEKYLRKFSSRKYTLIKTKKGTTGTCSGLNDALKHLSNKEPFLYIWCDLLLGKTTLRKVFNKKKIEKNYIGISKTFPSRWQYSKDGIFYEEKSNREGVMGAFVFKNKLELVDLPESGSFVEEYLSSSTHVFEPVIVKDCHEIGTIEAYDNFVSDKAQTRPFNQIVFKGKKVVKKPLNEQGRNLAKNEKAWYKKAKLLGITNIPKVYSFNPFVIGRIAGEELFKLDCTKAEKKKIISEVVDGIKKIHVHQVSRPVHNICENNCEAIVHKTKRRIDSVAELIPFINDDEIVINGKRCINFYKHWNLVDKLADSYCIESQYTFIHGDCTFSNMLFDTKNKRVVFIDPRGYYGDIKIWGDPDYDWAKLYYSMRGNYDQFNVKNFEIDYSNKGIFVNIPSSGWEQFVPDVARKAGYDENKIMFYHAIIWLSFSSYAWDDYDSICGAFYNGLYYMQEIYEKSL